MTDIKPMTRDEIGSVADLVGKLTDEVRVLSYMDAVRLRGFLKEILDTVGEQLPGGYYGKCMQCEEVKGEDEMQDCGDERFCTDCIAKWEAEQPKKRTRKQARTR